MDKFEMTVDMTISAETSEEAEEKLKQIMAHSSVLEYDLTDGPNEADEEIADDEDDEEGISAGV